MRGVRGVRGVTPLQKTSCRQNYDVLGKCLYKIMQKIVVKKTAVCKNVVVLTTKGSEMLA